MDPPDFENDSDFEGEPRVLLDKDGEKVVTIVKATYELAPRSDVLEIAPKKRRRGVRSIDVPWGKPEISSYAYPSDLCVRKPGTDVVCVGRSYPPNGQPAATWDVAVQVGNLQKLLRVFGLRVWEAGGRGFSPPRPIEMMEMRYDFAWGGTDDSDPEKFVEEARNPVGLGIARDPDSLMHQQMPSIEDPANLIQSWKTRPPPAGIGVIGRSWMPRREFIGTYDDAWLDERAPLPPLDQDDRLNLCASPGLISQVPLMGGEAVALLNLVPGGGATKFALPKTGVEIEVEAKGRDPQMIYPHLDTVVIDTMGFEPSATVVVELVWRAAIIAPRRMKDCKVIVRELDGK